MQLELWVSPCVFFGWWFSFWELWGVWLVDIIVLPMGLQTLSFPSILPICPPLGSPCSVPCSVLSIWNCIGQALVEPLRRQLYHLPVSKHFFSSMVVSGFGSWSSPVAVSGWPYHKSLLYSLSLHFLQTGAILRYVARGDEELGVATVKSQMPGKQEAPRTHWGWQ